MSQFRPLPLQLVSKDPKLRLLFEAIEFNLRALFGLLNRFLETDHERGEVRVTGPVRPRVVQNPPDEVSTFGRDLEIVSVQPIGAAAQTEPTLFQKRKQTRTDKQWQPVEVTPAATVQPLFFYQATAPTNPLGPALWWQPLAAGKMQFWHNMRTDDSPETWEWIKREKTT